MEILSFPEDSSQVRWRQTVLALGNFDGFHRGHLKIIDRVRQRANKLGWTPAVLTFDPHPSRVVRPDKAPLLLMTREQWLEAMAQAGMRAVVFLHFTPEVSRWEPDVFVRTVLVEWLRVAEVWVGANFLFGHERSGNFSVLRSLGMQYGFRTDKLDPVRYKDFVVSSTRIRRLINEGKVDEAGALLGHHYFIDGTVNRGVGRGKSQGFPTANICTENELLPPKGVYASLVTLNKVIYRSVTNVGIRPTFGSAGQIVVETHILDLARDLYGSRLRLSFIQRLRDEQVFSSVDALVTQIKVDYEQARKLFDKISL